MKLLYGNLINRDNAKKFAKNNNLEFFYHGNGQGLVGAIGAIGYEFEDNTLNYLSYRKKSKFGKKERFLVTKCQKKCKKKLPSNLSTVLIRKRPYTNCASWT